MEHNTKKSGLANSIVLFVVAALSLWIALLAQSQVGQAGFILMGIGTLVSLFSVVQAHLIDRERLERLEMQEIERTRSGESLFEGQAEDTFPAHQARRQFERFVVPAFGVGVLALQGAGLWWIWKLIGDWRAPIETEATNTIMFFALFALVLFLMGKYSAGLAKLEGQRLLRPGAGYLLLGAMACSVVVLTQVASYFEYPRWDRYATWVALIILSIATAENLVTLVLEFYRPRVEGHEARLLYESRLIGLLSQPGGLITTAAQALDYQFGFKVSETWFYRFLEKALAWIILLQLGVLFLSSCFVIIQPNERAIREHFGKSVISEEMSYTWGPGLRLKWPWPIDQVYRFKTEEIKSFTLGVGPDEDKPQAAQGKENEVLLWTTQHNHSNSENLEENYEMIVASSADAAGTQDIQVVPVNLLTVSIPVQYRIKSFKDWFYENAGDANSKTPNAGEILEKLAMREVTRYLISEDIEKLMSTGRTAARIALEERIQARADKLKLGVEIVFVGLQDIHPPVGANEQSKETGGVAENYEKVVVAQVNSETNILGAMAYQASKVPQAHAEAEERLSVARSESKRKVALAAAGAKRFKNQLKAFQAAPSVYKSRTKLETFQESIQGTRKYVLATTNSHEVINLELQDKLRDDLLDVTVDEETP